MSFAAIRTQMRKDDRDAGVVDKAVLKCVVESKKDTRNRNSRPDELPMNAKTSLIAHTMRPGSALLPMAVCVFFSHVFGTQAV